VILDKNDRPEFEINSQLARNVWLSFHLHIEIHRFQISLSVVCLFFIFQLIISTSVCIANFKKYCSKALLGGSGDDRRGCQQSALAGVEVFGSGDEAEAARR
jgi:hypothetical protein